MKQSDQQMVIEYWLRHYVASGACSLCGNSGVIHTEGIRTAAGVEVGRANYCICPNGQEMRRRAYAVADYERMTEEE